MPDRRRHRYDGDPGPYGRALPRGGLQLPAGRHAFSKEFVARSQRERLFDAMAHAVADKGYERTAVADVIERAGVSRRTFYENFADKQDCFIAAYRAIFADIFASVLEAYNAEREWPAKLSAGIAALLQRLAAEPTYARAGIVEVLAAGPEAIAVRDQSLVGFRPFFDGRLADAPVSNVPDIVVEATIGGIYEVIYRRIVTEGPESLPALHAGLVYLALAPFVGPEAATRESGLVSDGAASVPGRRASRRLRQ
jgi:AcrR family transcriptional regulator